MGRAIGSNLYARLTDFVWSTAIHNGRSGLLRLLAGLRAAACGQLFAYRESMTMNLQKAGVKDASMMWCFGLGDWTCALIFATSPANSPVQPNRRTGSRSNRR